MFEPKLSTDADGCVSAGKVLNVTRDACCAACVNETKCVAWAWGTDSADASHKHNCYMCSGLEGTKHSSVRDFGCVERTDASPPLRQPRTNHTYHGIVGAFSSTPDEVLVGLGQRSMVAAEPCTGGPRCGQQKLNQKGYHWALAPGHDKVPDRCALLRFKPAVWLPLECAGGGAVRLTAERHKLDLRGAEANR